MVKVKNYWNSIEHSHQILYSLYLERNIKSLKLILRVLFTSTTMCIAIIYIFKGETCKPYCTARPTEMIHISMMPGLNSCFFSHTESGSFDDLSTEDELYVHFF